MTTLEKALNWWDNLSTEDEIKYLKEAGIWNHDQGACEDDILEMYKCYAFRDGIKIQKITPPVCEFFDPKGNSLGFLNEYEFHAARVEIKKKSIAGYQAIFELPNGNVELLILDEHGRGNFTENMFPEINNFLMELL